MAGGESSDEPCFAFTGYAVVGMAAPFEATAEAAEAWGERAMDVVDVVLVAGDEEPPDGFIALRRTLGEHSRSAACRGDAGEAVVVCFRRRGGRAAARGLPAVTDLQVVRKGADAGALELLTKTPQGRDARLRGGHHVAVARSTAVGAAALRDVAVISPELRQKVPRDYAAAGNLAAGVTAFSNASLALVIRKGSPSGPLQCTWRTALLDKYPRTNDDFADEVLPMLAWPHGLQLEEAPRHSPPPVRYVPYAMIAGGMAPIFVSSLVFYEPLDAAEFDRCEALVSQRGAADDVGDCGDAAAPAKKAGEPEVVWYAPKCVCLLSTCAGLADCAKRALAAMYTLALSSCDLPLEGIIAHLVARVPAPCRGGAPMNLRIHASLPPIEVRLLRAPPDAELPALGVATSVRCLLACMDPPTAVAAWAAAVAERRLLLVSRRAALVTEVAEALRGLLFPLRWEGVYVPRLAEPILETLDFPGAILAGIDVGGGARGERFLKMALDKADESGGYVVLMLDDGEIHYPKKNCSDEYNSHQNPVDLRSRLSESAAGMFGVAAGMVNGEKAEAKSILPDHITAMLVKRWAQVGAAAGVRACDAARDASELVFDNAPPPSALRKRLTRAKRLTSSIYYEDDDEDRFFEDDDAPLCWTRACERAARDAALTAMAMLLDGYAEHLVRPGVDYYSVSSSSLFDAEAFASAAADPQMQNARRKIVETQAWSRFSQRRVETSDADLVLFDECETALRDAREAHRASIVRGDALLLDAVDAAHDMREIVADSPSKEAVPKAASTNDLSSRLPKTSSANRVLLSSSWRDDRLLRSHMAVDAKCTYGTDAKGKPRIDVAAPLPAFTAAGKKGPRYSYFELGRGLKWPCPLDARELPAPALLDAPEAPPSRSSSVQDAQTQSRMLARSQAELLLDMGLSVVGLRLGGGSATPKAAPKKRNAAAVATATRHALHAYGAWFLFLPALVRQGSKAGVSAAMLVALGVFERVVDAPCDPDEAIFRALLVAAGRAGPACKPVVASLFTQLRSLGIRPNALTFGQYTRAIAERDCRRSAIVVEASNADSTTAYDSASALLRLLEEALRDEGLDADSSTDEGEDGVREKRPANVFSKRPELGGALVAKLLRSGIAQHRRARRAGSTVVGAAKGAAGAAKGAVGAAAPAKGEKAPSFLGWPAPRLAQSEQRTVVVVVVKLEKPMGIVFEAVGVVGARIKELKGAALADGTLQVGDSLHAVDGQACDAADFATCLAHIAKASGAGVELVVSRAAVGARRPSFEEDEADEDDLAAYGGQTKRRRRRTVRQRGYTRFSEEQRGYTRFSEATEAEASRARDSDDEASARGSSEVGPGFMAPTFAQAVAMATAAAADALRAAETAPRKKPPPLPPRAPPPLPPRPAPLAVLAGGGAPRADGCADDATVSSYQTADDTPSSLYTDATAASRREFEDVDSLASPVSAKGHDASPSAMREQALSPFSDSEGDDDDADEDTVEAAVARLVDAVVRNVAALPGARARGADDDGSADDEGDTARSVRARRMMRKSIARLAEFGSKSRGAAAAVASKMPKDIGSLPRNLTGRAVDFAAATRRRLAQAARRDFFEEGLADESADLKRRSRPVCVAASLDHALRGDADGAPRGRVVAAMWSGCTSPHHPEEAPLDEEIMAAWPEELGVREARCSFTQKPYSPQLAYCVLELDRVEDGKIFVRLWGAASRAPVLGAEQRGKVAPSTKGSSLYEEHPATLSAFDKSALDFDTPLIAADAGESIELSALLRAAGVAEYGPAAESGDAQQALEDGVGRCAYLSPLQLRYDLELQLQRYGDEALEAGTLALQAPALFWSLWWYCARLELPFPAAPSTTTAAPDGTSAWPPVQATMPHVAVAAWDRRGALAAAAAAMRQLAGVPDGTLAAAAHKAAAGPAAGDARQLESAAVALLGGLREPHSRRARIARLRAQQPVDRVRDAAALLVDARTRDERSTKSRDESDIWSTSDDADDDADDDGDRAPKRPKPVAAGAPGLYRALLRLNDPSLVGSIATLGDDHAEPSPFDAAYAHAMAALAEDDPPQAFTLKDKAPSDRALVFRNIFGHLF